MGGGGDVYEVAQCSLVGRKVEEERVVTGGQTEYPFAIIHLLYCFRCTHSCRKLSVWRAQAASSIWGPGVTRTMTEP